MGRAQVLGHEHDWSQSSPDLDDPGGTRTRTDSLDSPADGICLMGDFGALSALTRIQFLPRLTLDCGSRSAHGATVKECPHYAHDPSWDGLAEGHHRNGS